jgi:hypothetical protein
MDKLRASGALPRRPLGAHTRWSCLGRGRHLTQRGSAQSAHERTDLCSLPHRTTTSVCRDAPVRPYWPGVAALPARLAELRSTRSAEARLTPAFPECRGVRRLGGRCCCGRVAGVTAYAGRRRSLSRVRNTRIRSGACRGPASEFAKAGVRPTRGRRCSELKGASRDIRPAPLPPRGCDNGRPELDELLPLAQSSHDAGAAAPVVGDCCRTTPATLRERDEQAEVRASKRRAPPVARAAVVTLKARRLSLSSRPVRAARLCKRVIPALAAGATGQMPALVHCHASDPIVSVRTRFVVRTRLSAQRPALPLCAAGESGQDGSSRRSRCCSHAM